MSTTAWVLSAGNRSSEKAEGERSATPVAESTTAAEVSPPSAAPDEVSYVGTNQCFICHRTQTNAWSETDHSQAFTHLPEKYQANSSCLQCHITAFGEREGFVVGGDKDLLMVGCEACHGPGSRHIDAAQRFVLAMPGEEEAIEKEMRETIIKTPTDKVCAGCHVTQRHGAHPAYDGKATTPGVIVSRKTATNAPVQCIPPWLSTRHARTGSAAAHLPSGYSVKTCGGCHYDQYQQWRDEKHSDVAAMLPAKHASDQECQTCHSTADAAAEAIKPETDSEHQWVGLACESCHGPAHQHVRYNRQFISGPRLSARHEQAARASITSTKPAATCIRCHIHERHGEHPQFEQVSETE